MFDMGVLQGCTVTSSVEFQHNAAASFLCYMLYMCIVHNTQCMMQLQTLLAAAVECKLPQLPGDPPWPQL
jgi:hypothetical protein